jgi:hypothetical protein
MPRSERRPRARRQDDSPHPLATALLSAERLLALLAAYLCVSGCQPGPFASMLLAVGCLVTPLAACGVRARAARRPARRRPMGRGRS